MSCVTPPISSPTATSAAGPKSRTVSPSAGSTTQPTTRTSWAWRRTTYSTSGVTCWRSTTGRCSVGVSRRWKGSGSSCPGRPRAGRTPDTWRSATPGFGWRDLASFWLGLSAARTAARLTDYRWSDPAVLDPTPGASPGLRTRRLPHFSFPPVDLRLSRLRRALVPDGHSQGQALASARCLERRARPLRGAF